MGTATCFWAPLLEDKHGDTHTERSTTSYDRSQSCASIRHIHSHSLESTSSESIQRQSSSQPLPKNKTNTPSFPSFLPACVCQDVHCCCGERERGNHYSCCGP